MTDETPRSETLEEFKNSFSYGSRSDLSFKFLKSLHPDEAAEFFRQVLHEIGASFDHGELDPLHRIVWEWQVRAYTPREGAARTHVYDEGPFTPTPKPLSESRLGLLTSSGHFVAGDDPEPLGVADMTQEEAEERIQEFLRATPELSEISVDTPLRDLRVRHGGYDIRSVAADANVAFPLQHLRDKAASGEIGSLAPVAYSFPGSTSQGRLRQELPSWIERFREQDIDVMLLVPV